MGQTKKLNPRQERFVLEFLTTSNATQSAINAGYSAKTASDIGVRLLKHPVVQKRLAVRVGISLSAADATSKRVVEELVRIAFGDTTSMYDESGNLKPLSELHEDAKRTISSIETTETTFGGGEKQQTRRNVKIRTHDKLRALEILAKYLGMLVERVEISASSDLTARLAAGRARVPQLQAPVIDAEVVRARLATSKEDVSALSPPLEGSGCDNSDPETTSLDAKVCESLGNS